MARMRLFTALEDLAEDSTVYGDTPYGEEIEAADVDARDEMEEARESSDHIDDLMDSAEEGIEDTETLQEIGGAIGEAAEKGEGLDESAMEPATISVEALCKNLAIENFKIMPALESFGSSNSRLQATKRAAIAIEGVGSDAVAKIRKLIAFIGEKLAQLLEKISQMYHKGMLAYKMRIKKEVEKLPAGVGEDIKSKGIVRAFGSPSATEVDFKKVKEVLDAHQEVGKAITKLANEGPANVELVVAAAKASNSTAEGIKNSGLDKFKTILRETFDGKRLADGVHIEVTEENGWARPEFKSDWTGKEVSEDAHAKCLDKRQIEEILNQVEVIFKQALKDKEDGIKLIRAVNAKADELSKLGDVSEENKKAAMTTVDKMAHSMYAVIKESFRLQNSALKDSLDYCKESIVSIKKAHKETK